MKKGINGWTFSPQTPIAAAARQAAAAGFAALEPVMTDTGELRPDTDEPTCRALADAIRAAGIEVSAVACGMFWTSNYTARDPSLRQAAIDLTIALLDRAGWLGAPAALVIPGVVGRWDETTPRIRYDDALAAAMDALRGLSCEAERRGVVIAIENVWNRFLLSPTEMRDLIDHVNSPWVKVCLDVGNVMPFGYPQDWIAILGRRIARVHVKDFKLGHGDAGGFCPVGDGDVNWPAVLAALRQARYEGPLTYEGPGELQDISVRLDKVLTAS